MTLFDPAIRASLMALLVADFSVVFPTALGTLPEVASPAIRFTRQTLQVACVLVQILLVLTIVETAGVGTAMIAPSRECRTHQFANVLHICVELFKRPTTHFTIASIFFKVHKGRETSKVLTFITASVTRPRILPELVPVELFTSCHDCLRLRPRVWWRICPSLPLIGDRAPRLSPPWGSRRRPRPPCRPPRCTAPAPSAPPPPRTPPPGRCANPSCR